jgi:hypothetical protein
MVTLGRSNDIEAEFETLLNEIGSLKNLSKNSKTLSKDFRPLHNT